MREIVHIQAGQCGNQIGAKVCTKHLRIALIEFKIRIKYSYQSTWRHFCAAMWQKLLRPPASEH